MASGKIGFDPDEVQEDLRKIQRGKEGLPEVTRVKKYEGTRIEATEAFHSRVQDAAVGLAGMTADLAFSLKSLEESLRETLNMLAKSEDAAAETAKQLLKHLDEAADAADAVQARASATTAGSTPAPLPKGRNAIG